MSLEALPAEILYQILDLSRPHDFESLAVTCKKAYVIAYHFVEEHRRCKQNMTHKDAAYHYGTSIQRFRLLVNPKATLAWLCRYAAQCPIDQLRYVDTIHLDFPQSSNDRHIFGSLEEARSTTASLYAALQKKSCDILQILSDGATLQGGLEQASRQLRDADLNFCTEVLCQLALAGLTFNAPVLIIAKGYLAYMHDTLQKLSTSPLNIGFLQNIREVIIRDRGPTYGFSVRSLSTLFELPQLRAITIRNLTADPRRVKRRWPESLQPAVPTLSQNVTALILVETIWDPNAPATRILSLLPKLRSMTWQSGWHGYWSPSSPVLDIFDQYDEEEELEDYAAWFRRYRRQIDRDEQQGAVDPLSTVQMSDRNAESVHHGVDRDQLQSTSESTTSSDSDPGAPGYRLLALEGHRRTRRGIRRGRASQRRGYESRFATYQQLARSADDLASDELVKQATSDGELDLDGSCPNDADEMPSLDWYHPDPFQPSVLLEALCRLFGDQLEHLAVSVFGSVQAANQVAREHTVVHFLNLVKLTHLDLDTRILRPRRGSQYQHMSLHRVLPPSIKQLALTILHCFLSVELHNLLGQLSMHRSSLPRLGSVFVRVLMPHMRVVSPEDEERFERLHDELAHVDIRLRWSWVGAGTEVKPGLDWDDSKDIMPSTYQLDPGPRLS